jgi:hypothetical protein
MDGLLKSGHLVKIFELLLPHMCEPSMPELVSGSAFTFRAGSIWLSQGISRVIDLDLAILRHRHTRSEAIWGTQMVKLLNTPLIHGRNDQRVFQHYLY